MYGINTEKCLQYSIIKLVYSISMGAVDNALLESYTIIYFLAGMVCQHEACH